MKTIKVILGLGNAPKKYHNTYHNLGHLFLDWLKEKWHYPIFKEEKSLLSEISFLKENNILLAKNLTFMNESFKTVKLLKKKYGYQLENFLIVHDDSDLFLNKFKFCFNRGAGGHKGVEGIIKNIGKNFYRLKIGIRNPNESQREKAEKLVLKNIPPKEKEAFLKIFETIEKELLKFLKDSNNPKVF